MTRRRAVLGRLRGWGGVAAMAVAIVLTAVFVLLPVLHSRGQESGASPGGPGVAKARPAADSCKDPEASVRPSGGSGPEIEKIKDRGRLVVGVDQNSYRWGYRDPNKPGGDLEGFDIDLVHEIAEKILGDPDKVQFRAIPTNQRIPAIQSGDVDMVVRTMTINCERIEDVDFSTAYFETGQQVLAPKNSKITGYDDSLSGKKLCLATGSTAEAALKKKSYGADLSTTVPNQLDCLVRLQLGEVDAIVTDGALGAGQAAQDPTIELKGEPFTEEFYGVAMKKGATKLVARVNQVLVDYRKNGWKASYDAWLAADLGKSSGPPAAKYR
ncbi:sugar-binding protein [Streptomyces albus]|uniref:Sugar-binding protein n=2 Tax=Streptomyces TaxID=1883 RepID=A0A0B5F3V7_STRA4|nr:sugar-binding protein [Streptomyces albus]AOU79899.1 sugar-binding protein [Streptomyces albus]AYN35617.1 sugar-binding protein [Streptomyces albus]